MRGRQTWARMYIHVAVEYKTRPMMTTTMARTPHRPIFRRSGVGEEHGGRVDNRLSGPPVQTHRHRRHLLPTRPSHRQSAGTHTHTHTRI